MSRADSHQVPIVQICKRVGVVVVEPGDSNASAFDNIDFNISDRNQTSASVSWSPAIWSSVGATAAEQRTSDLTSIVQEIVSETDWNSGNAMAFILTGSGKRVAEAYDGDQSGAPQLYIEYTTSEVVIDPVVEVS